MKLDVFGRHVEVSKRDGAWTVFYLGDEGKKRPAADIRIPDSIGEDEVIAFIDDLCHEWASPDKPSVLSL
ncbi:DUF7661 family protein [Aestuariibacter salexigens]|uniref:DUF7661 family protein n=1 Tax=Aestuariibacter salexigens TaxID=226010 RepID=UPI00041953FA|nr:hypothetical protein [Aestuariibacter salexigens]